ncbi:MAG: Holliday junction resolvase RuvX [Oscillospiraceae bacterium]|nr:Holliday junction resolvase RuvX [Oscillospiraceae bacterium]MBR0352453.1 Holliday junction resolvase RuvX [Oscillospiraceae bacterium]
MRILAVDYGDARTGLAVSDLSGLICADAWTIEEWNFDRCADRICTAAAEREAGLIVLGLPKNMDGTEGARAEKSRELKALLEEKSGLDVVLWDERLSTVQAHAILHSVGKKEKKHKRNVDAVAAELILESYLGSLR